MKKIIFSLMVATSLFAIEGTTRVDDVLRQLTKQYEQDQASKAKIERDRFDMDAKTAKLNNQKTIKDILQPTAIIKINNEYILFLLDRDDVFLRLTQNQVYKDIKVLSINENGFTYEFEGIKGYLPLQISSKVVEEKVR